MLHATDFSKCLMPPPLSMNQLSFPTNITSFSKIGNALLVITEDKVYLADLLANKIQE